MNGLSGWRSAEGFRIYVPTSIIGSPSLDGLSGALWEGFSAASDPETAATFWTAVATFCYTEARVLTCFDPLFGRNMGSSYKLQIDEREIERERESMQTNGNYQF